MQRDDSALRILEMIMNQQVEPSHRWKLLSSISSSTHSLWTLMQLEHDSINEKGSYVLTPQHVSYLTTHEHLYLQLSFTATAPYTVASPSKYKITEQDGVE